MNTKVFFRNSRLHFPVDRIHGTVRKERNITFLCRASNGPILNMIQILKIINFQRHEK